MFHVPPPVSTATVIRILGELRAQGYLTWDADTMPEIVPYNSQRNRYYHRDPREVGNAALREP